MSDFMDLASAALIGPWAESSGVAEELMGQGFGGSHVADLFKALEAGHDTASGGSDPSGYALRPESLEDAFHLQTYREEHAKLWRHIPKLKGFSTVEEYNRLDDYGDQHINPFAPEGELPPAEDSRWSRQLELMKFMGSTRVVSDVLRTVRTAHGDPVANEIRNGFTWIMRQINLSLYFADTDFNPTEFNGLWKQLNAGTSGSNIVDVRDTTNPGIGGHLTSDIIDDAAEQVYGLGGYGQLSELFYSTKAHKNFARQILGATGANVRFEPAPNAGGLVDAGFSMERFTSNFGKIGLKPDVFLNPVEITEATLTGSFAKGDASLRPGTPSFGAPTITPADGGNWGTSTGNYRYTMVAVNEYGNSAAPASQVAAVATAADSVTLSITWGAGGTPTGFVIYRSALAGTTFFEVARIDAGSPSPTSYKDVNTYIAGTSKAMAFTMNQDVLSFKQLLPMTKVPLAKIDLRKRFALILWGAPVLYSPYKAIGFRNISNVSL
jgi:hypothetical protein